MGVLSGSGSSEINGARRASREPGQPATAEHGKAVEGAVVLVVRVVQRANQGQLVGAAGRPRRDGADDAVDCHTDGRLELAGGGAGSGVDPEVKHHQGDTDRQQVAAHGVPVERLVDRIGFGNGQVADILRRDGAAAPVFEGRQGNAEIGGAAGIAGIVGKAALFAQGKSDGGIEWGHIYRTVK